MSVGSMAAKGRRAGRSRTVERLGRAGLVAKGALYAVMGVLAIKIALGAQGEESGKEGALRAIATQPLGRVLLGLLALGFAGYAAWRFAQGVLDRDGDDGITGVGKRVGAFAKGVWWSGLCVLTVMKLAGAQSGNGGGGGTAEDRTTAGVLGLPFGRYLVYAAALGFFVAAAFNGWRAVTCKFRDKLQTGRMSDTEEAAATGAGVLGHLARGTVWGVIGAFLAKAAWQYDPQEAAGLDAALREVAQQPYGGLLLGTVAVGLIAYAVYCVAQARYRDV